MSLRLIRTVLCSLAVAAAPLSAYAEDGIARGSFIMHAVDVFDISPKHTGTLPYRRVPKIQEPYIQAAYDKGALKVFTDKNFLAGRTITRGEAVMVLKGLSGMTPEKKDVQKFTDVKDAEMLDAVALSIEQQWLKPLRRSLFGVDRPLTISEEKLLIKRIERSIEAPSQVIKIPIQRTNPVQTEQSKTLDAVWQLLQKDFLYKDRLNSNKAGQDAAEALVKSLDDPYTVYLPPAESQQFQDQIHGELSGIGVQVEFREEGLLIVAPLPNSPAERAGLQGGDVITAVDGVELKGLSYQEAVMKVRGPKGSIAKLTIVRDRRTLEFSVQRDTVKVPEIELSMQGTVAVIRITQFGDTTEREIRGLLQKVADASSSALILDLRNNPGGLLHAADVLMGAFVPEGTVIANIHTRTGLYSEESTGDPIFPESFKVAVLVNKGSASASEIVAGAFQDLQRATVIGEKTFGKGTVQQIVEFRDGSSLKMTIAEWKTPQDRKIDGVGVTPDIIVDSTSEPDAALKKALELLR